jgi:hypothetical protein
MDWHAQAKRSALGALLSSWAIGCFWLWDVIRPVIVG